MLTIVTVSKRKAEHGKVSDIIFAKLEEGKNVSLEAYPGYGKTFIGLDVLRRFGRALYLTRTHYEMFDVINIALHVYNLKIYPAYGREAICYRKAPRGIAFPSYCRRQRVLGFCHEKPLTRTMFAFLSKMRKPGEIREYAKKLNTCLYLANKILALKSKYVLTTYAFYFQNPEIAENRPFMVLDECHTILEALQQSVIELSKPFIELTILSLKNKAKTENKPELGRLAYILKQAYNKSKSIYEFAEILDSGLDLVPYRTEETYILGKIVDSIRNKMFIKENNTHMILTLPPKIFTTKQKMLLMSALIPPFIFRNVNVHVAVEPSEEVKIPVKVDTSVTTRYKERTEVTPKELADKIEEYYDRNVGNLAIVPSKELREKVVKILEKKGFKISPIEKIKEVEEGDLIVDVAYGRVAEGVNPSPKLKRVIIAGMPYPPPELRLKLLAKYFGFDNIYTYLALLKSFQAVGRIRKPEGSLAVLIDKRFKEYEEKYPTWVKLV